MDSSGEGFSKGCPIPGTILITRKVEMLTTIEPRARARRCTNCGYRIPKERLEAIPATLTCVECSNTRALTTRDVEIDSTDLMDLIDAAQQPDRG